MDDWKLLQNYIERDSQAAFQTIMTRYLNFVHALALRHVKDSQLAEEVTQAVFVLLAKKAPSFRRGTILSGWLFRTTRFVASRAARTEQRRMRREQEAFQMQQLSTADDTWRRISPIIDEALESLGKTDRNAILLRYFNDKSHHETAALLGVSEEAAKKRVTRAVEKLRHFFARRGIALSAALLASAVAANGHPNLTSEIARNIIAKTVATVAVGKSSLLPLVAQTLKAWRLMKVMATGAVTALTVLVLLWVGGHVHNGTARLAKPLNPVHQRISDQQTAQVSQQSGLRKSHNIRAMRLRVVAAEGGGGIPFARLSVNTVVETNWSRRFDLATDETGLCELPLPAGLGRLDVGVMAIGWEARFATWRLGKDRAFPSEYTLRVRQVTNSVGGWLRDVAGSPVAGAEIWMQIGGGGDAFSRETPRERAGLFDEAPVAISGRDGRWNVCLIPQDNQEYYSLEARHPSFAPTHIESGNPPNGEEDLKRETFKQLWAGKLLTTMNSGLTLQGRVSDEAGQPIPEASIYHRPHTIKGRSFIADKEGRFEISGLAAGKFPITATAAGFAPEFRDVDVSTGTQQVSFQLKPGAQLRLLITDPQGSEISDARAVLEQWGENRNALKWEAASGPDGRIEWNSAPFERLQLCIVKDGWCFNRDVSLIADGQEHKIVLQPGLILAGHVTDAKTGVPVATFKAFPGYGDGPSNLVWARGDTRVGENGDFTVQFSEMAQPWRVCVEAEGYITATSEPIARDFDRVLQLKLHRLTAESGINGAVYLPDGQPASGAEVALCTLEQSLAVYLSGDHFARPYYAPVVKTDNVGRFSFTPNREAHTLIAVHPAGFARVPLERQSGPNNIALKPWGRIEGRVRSEGFTSNEWRAVLIDWASAQYNGGLGLDKKCFNSPLDATGNFKMENVPPGNFYICLERDFNSCLLLYTPVTVKPAQTVSVQVGGVGRLVAGRFDVGEVMGVTNWEEQVQGAILFPSTRPPRPTPKGLSGHDLKMWEISYWQSDAGHMRLFENRSFPLDVASDGAFTGHDILPGTYNLFAHLRRSRIPHSEGIGKLSKQIVIPGEPNDTEKGILDVGTLEFRNAKP